MASRCGRYLARLSFVAADFETITSAGTHYPEIAIWVRDVAPKYMVVTGTAQRIYRLRGLEGSGSRQGDDLRRRRFPLVAGSRP
jgi:hypothetical protein